MDRDTTIILRKMIIDFLCLLVVGLCVLGFFFYGTPFERGFFCNDESLYHPHGQSTVTSLMLYFVGICFPVCVMILGEYLHARNMKGQSARIFFGHAIPPWVWNAYSKVGVFGFGALSTILITDIAKYNIGRLRPHFMAVCQPNINCSLATEQYRYIEDFECTSTGFTAKDLKEMRLSFPSGHSSFSAFTMIYLALYLQLRFTWRGSKLLKHALQLICFLMAWYTAMTRVSNYKHHWSDVLAGSSLGIILALVVANFIGNLFKDEDDCCEGNNHMTPAYETEGTQDESSPLRTCSRAYGDVPRELQEKPFE